MQFAHKLMAHVVTASVYKLNKIFKKNSFNFQCSNELQGKLLWEIVNSFEIESLFHKFQKQKSKL